MDTLDRLVEVERIKAHMITAQAAIEAASKKFADTQRADPDIESVFEETKQWLECLKTEIDDYAEHSAMRAANEAFEELEEL